MNFHVPAYDLYGEILSSGLSDPLHYEPIKDRSSQHNWTIRLHKHNRLAQIFFLESIGATFQLDDTVFTNVEPVILVIPPGLVHGFEFPNKFSGEVLSIQMDLLQKQDKELFSKVTENGAMLLIENEMDHFENLKRVIGQIKQTYQTYNAHRLELLNGFLKICLLYLSLDSSNRKSASRKHRDTKKTKYELYADEFCANVERCFSRPKSVEEYAEELAISAPHLTRICKKCLGVSPHELVRQRRMLEAKRLLRYTRMSASEIAAKVGFEEAPYFCRVFKAATGETPMQYRNKEAIN